MQTKDIDEVVSDVFLKMLNPDKDGNVKEEDLTVTEDNNENVTYTLPSLKAGESAEINDEKTTGDGKSSISISVTEKAAEQ